VSEEPRCSTTDQDLDDLFAAIDKEIQLDPDVAMDLLDVLNDEEEEGEEGGEEMGHIKSSIYLPQDDYEMEVMYGLECVGHIFAYVAHFVFLRDVWNRTQRAAVANRHAPMQLSHHSHQSPST
jgi:hypothetical protein